MSEDVDRPWIAVRSEERTVPPELWQPGPGPLEPPELIRQPRGIVGLRPEDRGRDSHRRECPGRMKHRNPPTSLGLRLWTLACRRGLTVDCARLGRGQPGGGDGEGEAQEDHSEQYTAQVSPSSIPAPSQIRNGAVQL